MTASHFFFFGCWNRDNCEENKDYRKGVFDTILPIANKYHFGVIAGDNVYPQQKKYYKKTLDYGFELLQQVRNKTLLKHIYATIGNHDVNRTSVLEYQVRKHLSGEIYMPQNVYLQKVSPHLRLLFIDTNFFTRKHPGLYASAMDQPNRNIKVPKSLEHFFVSKTKEGTLAYIQELLHQDKAFQGWTLVVGHEPLISIKPKLKSRGMINKLTSLDHYQELLTILSSCKKTIYMAADVHTFQAWNIPWKGKNIPMIVAGTGGGDPDINLPMGGHYRTDEGHEMHLIASEHPYGYCEVECSKSSCVIQYKPLHGCSVHQKEVSIQYDEKQQMLKVLTTKEIPQSVRCAAPPVKQTQCIVEPSLEMMGGRNIKKQNSR